MQDGIKYLKVYIEGFQSIETLNFNLDRVGINLIKGINGVGKSTIFNSVLWCEYGVNLKTNIATWEDKRTDKWRGTRVIVDRIIGDDLYRVARHLDFKGTTAGLKGGSKLMLFKKKAFDADGNFQGKFVESDLIGDALHKKDMQELIDRQLGMDSKTYLNSIFFGQKLASLVSADNKDKRALFEKLFDSAFVDLAKENARTEKDKLTREYDKLESDISSAESKLERANVTLLEQRKTINTFEANKKSRLESISEAIDGVSTIIKDKTAEEKTLSKELKKIDTSNLDELKTQLSDLVGEEDVISNKLKGEKRKLQTTKDELEESDRKKAKYIQQLDEVKENCPYCTKALPKKEVAEVKNKIQSNVKSEDEVQKILRKGVPIIEKAITDLSNELEVLSPKVTEKRSEIRGFDALISKKATLEANIKNCASLIKSSGDTKKQLEADYKKEEEAKMPDIDIESTEKIVEECQDIITNGADKLKTLNDTIEKISWWMTKGFGSGGLKAFIFNAMLNKLNVLAQQYASKLGFGVQFSVDMTKASKPFKTTIYSGGFERDYGDLSGGQRQRVDICIAFAMYDLISSSKPINMLVMDEFTDGLDEAGVSTLFSIIQEKAEAGKAVFVITHLSMIDSMYCKTIGISEEDGHTFVE